MEKNSKKYEIDMCTGPLALKMLKFTLPLMLSSLLQLMFNSADLIVAGKYAGGTALASISGTSSLTNLIINLFVGLSVGTNVCISKYYGQKSDKDVSETVSTAVLSSLISGIFLAVFGFLMARPLLTLMKTPETVIEGSILYMRIYFLGMPVVMLYNFTSAILRAVGDTRRPLYYLSFAGVLNVVLNLFFVKVVGIGVAGVAIATVISQALSATLMVITLCRYKGCLHLELCKMKIYPKKLAQMARIGLPAGLQGSFFSISNVIIQSSINSFGELAMTGNAAAQNIEGYVYVAMNSFHHTTLSFTGQNFGGRKFDRIKRVMINGLLFVSAAGLFFGSMAYIFGKGLLEIFMDTETTSPENIQAIIEYGKIRMKVIMFSYFTCGTMDVIVGGLRGLGKSIPPMILTMLFVCVMRVVWVYTVFAQMPTLECLYVSYPVSWILATVVEGTYYIFAYRNLKKKNVAYETE